MNDKVYILIVDDAPFNLELLSELLNEAYITQTAQSGAEAIRMAQYEKPEIVLLDVSMPEMDGYEVCQRFKADEKLCDIPIIFLSALDTTIDKLKGFEVGGVDYIVKPFSPTEVLARVKIHVALRAAQRQLQEQNKQLQEEIIRRERAEDQLRSSEEKYRSLFAKTNDAVFIIGLDFQIQEVNQRAADLWQIPIEEIVGRRWIDFVLPDETEETINRAKQLLAGTVLPIYERVFRLKNGRVFPAEINATLIDDNDGNPLYFHSVVRDISERKQSEAERERLIAELDAFAHTVAHDLKSPLSAVKITSDVLETMFDKMDENRRNNMLQTMQSSADKMVNIVDALLLLAGIRKQDEIPVYPLDMLQIVVEAMERLKKQIAQQKAECIIADSFPSSLGYAPWIEEVWVNYISNALKYGGTPCHIEVGGDALPDGSVRFWVKDNGAGLSVDEQKRLFTPFTRLNQIKIDGHGLGLSIVQRIVAKLGGKVGVESQIGSGSTFYFTLPSDFSVKTSHLSQS